MTNVGTGKVGPHTFSAVVRSSRGSPTAFQSRARPEPKLHLILSEPSPRLYDPNNIIGSDQTLFIVPNMICDLNTFDLRACQSCPFIFCERIDLFRNVISKVPNVGLDFP